MKQIVVLLIILTVILSSCDDRVWDNPVDPDSDEYFGYESEDNDGDGLGQFSDIDEVENIDPPDNYIFTDGELVLECSDMDPDIVEEYRIQISETQDFAEIVYTDSGTGTEFTVDLSDFDNSTDYYWRSSASDGSEWSNSDSATVWTLYTDVLPNGTPENLSVESDGDGGVVLNWDDNSNYEDGFYIERKTGSGGTWSRLTTLTSGIETYNDETTVHDTEYYYRVQSYRALLNAVSGYSNEQNLTAVIDPPATPGTLVLQTHDNGWIILTWDDNSNNEDGFYIERKTGAGGTWSRISTMGSGIETYTDETTEHDTEYYYRIQSYRDSLLSIVSGYSNEPNLTAQISSPAAPGLLFLYNIDEGWIMLEWVVNSNNEDGFYIERKTGIGGSWSRIGTVGSGNRYYTDETTVHGTEYYYRVQAFRSIVVSGYSSENNLTAQITPPDVPTGLSSYSPSSEQINVSWSINSYDVDGFYLYKKLDTDTEYVLLADIPAGTTSYDDSNCTFGKTYNYMVRSYWLGQTSADSTVLSVQSEIRYSTVDTNGRAYNDIVLDENDFPHISYTSESYDLYYAYKDESGWHTELAASGYIEGNSIALDSYGRPCIAYVDGSNEELHYVRWNGSAWIVEDVYYGGEVIKSCNLLLDGDDNPHITYDNGGYARKTTGTWEIEDLTESYTGPMVMDDGGVIHMSAGNSSGQVVHVYGSYRSWTTEVIGDMDRSRTSIAIGSDNSVHIAYHTMVSSTMYLRYAVDSGSGWVITNNIDTDIVETEGYHLDLALDSSDNPHISFFKFNTLSIRYARWTGSSWEITIVRDGSSDYGWKNALAIDSNDNPHISFCRWDSTSTGEMQYAH